MKKGRADIAVIASYGDSLVNFRGHLLRTMRQSGMRVLVLAPEISQAAASWFVKEGVEFREAPLSRTGTNALDDLRYLLWLRRTLRDVSPQALLAYTVKPVVYSLLTAPRHTRKYALITGLGYAFTGAGGERRMLANVVSGLYRVALLRADRVFFQNPDDERLFRSRGLVPTRTPSQVVAGSGIDLMSYNVMPLPEGPPRFLLIARLLGDKGVREYVQAARSLKARYPEITASIVGFIDSNPDAIRERELADWIAEGTIEFLGRLQDVRPAIAACTVYVLPSYREGTPRTVLEAMSMGRAVITTDAPGCRETVVPEYNGLLVAARSAAALEKAMERFILRPELACEMGARGRVLAEEKYDVRRVTLALMRGMKLSP